MTIVMKLSSSPQIHRMAIKFKSTRPRQITIIRVVRKLPVRSKRMMKIEPRAPNNEKISSFLKLLNY